jgi:hypothetical protein
MEHKPPPIVIEQQIRNRIFEYLESVAEYPRNAGVWDLNELVNSWETWVDDPFKPSDFPSPVFSPQEVASMEIAHDAWLKFANATPRKIGDEQRALSLPEWKVFVDSCASAARMFDVRGRLLEDDVLDNDA